MPSAIRSLRVTRSGIVGGGGEWVIGSPEYPSPQVAVLHCGRKCCGSRAGARHRRDLKNSSPVSAPESPVIRALATNPSPALSRVPSCSTAGHHHETRMTWLAARGAPRPSHVVRKKGARRAPVTAPSCSQSDGRPARGRDKGYGRRSFGLPVAALKPRRLLDKRTCERGLRAPKTPLIPAQAGLRENGAPLLRGLRVQERGAGEKILSARRCWHARPDAGRRPRRALLPPSVRHRHRRARRRTCRRAPSVRDPSRSRAEWP